MIKHSIKLITIFQNWAYWGTGKVKSNIAASQFKLVRVAARFIPIMTYEKKGKNDLLVIAKMSICSPLSKSAKIENDKISTRNIYMKMNAIWILCKICWYSTHFLYSLQFWHCNMHMPHKLGKTSHWLILMAHHPLYRDGRDPKYKSIYSYAAPSPHPGALFQAGGPKRPAPCHVVGSATCHM